MNVVEQWRERGRNLRAEYWRCDGCSAWSAVRRVSCPHCGSTDKFAKVKLPAKLKAIGWSHDHLAIEKLDQRAQVVMLLETPQGRPLAMQLAEADHAHASRLVGELLDVVLRRAQEAGASAPIAYGRKVAASARTRAALKNSEIAKRAVQGG